MRMIGAASLVAMCGMLACAPARAESGAAVQGQRYRRHHRLSAGLADGCPPARGRSLRVLRQGGEIPRGRAPVWRLHLVRLPLGALWRQRSAAAHPLLSRPSHPIRPTQPGARSMTRQLLSIVSGGLPAGAAAGARCARGGNAGSQGGPVGNEDAADRLAAARNDDAALHRRDHRQGDEHDVLADVEGNLLQARHPEDRDRLRLRFRLQRRRHVDDLAFRDHRRLQFRLYRQVHLAQRGRPRRRAARLHARRSRRSGWAPASPIRSPATS